MSIKPATVEDIRTAMHRFDAELRNTPEWQDWEKKKTHKFAFNEKGQRYPMKEIISMASGTPTSDFSGGEESIRFASNFELPVEALHLPSFGETKSALHDLALAHMPTPLSPQQAYSELGDQFRLSKSLRTLQMDNSQESWWENRVRQARRQLVDEDILDNRERGTWELKTRPNQLFWIEKSKVKGRLDRESGPHSLGRALWSPTRDVRGADVYRNMRLVEPGDVVLHIVDDDRVSGVSVAASRPDPNFVGLKGTDWADRPCYRIELRDYEELSPPIHRSQFLKNPDHQDELRDILNHNDNLFYNVKLELNQGAYFTEAPGELVHMFDEIYRETAGRGLPHVANLESKSLSQLSERRLRAAILLFRWCYGEEGLASSRYVASERDYKVELVKEWNEFVTRERLEQAIASEAPEEFAATIGGLFTKTNLLPWRYADAVRSFSDSPSARTFLILLRDLLFSETSDAPDIDTFNNGLMPHYRSTLRETAIKPASHCIPSLALWLTYPEKHFFVRPELYNQVRRILQGTVAEGQGEVMTTAYYLSALEFATGLREAIRELNPRDMIDVQGFCWGIFSRYKVWFGGKSYGGKRDMLPEFLARQVYAIGFARREEIAALLKDVPNLDKQSRSARRAELEAKCENASERTALLNFFDMISTPGSLLLTKSTWYDQGLKQSLLKISGVGETGNHVAFDADLGHQIDVKWLSTPDLIVEGHEYFSELSRTLTAHGLDKALDIISLDRPRATPVADVVDEVIEELIPPLPQQPRYTVGDFAAETGFPTATIDGWRQRLMRKMHVVFQGPPGTGKTFIAERLARLVVSETTGDWDVVQFHPSYSYEDFIQGIRPQVLAGGGLTYQIEPGRFLDFCRKAEKRVDGAPCVLIIDELNRANLSRVFGELMYLLEYRDKKIPLSIGGAEFQIPKNVYVIGTMNTADRSVALVDHALRRRFSFIYLGPAYDVLQHRLQRDGIPTDGLIPVLRAINREIDDRNFEIGISFFMKDGGGLRGALEEIWKGEIEPYLEEYFYDEPKKVDAFRWEQLAAAELKNWPSTIA